MVTGPSATMLLPASLMFATSPPLFPPPPHTADLHLSSPWLVPALLESRHGPHRHPRGERLHPVLPRLPSATVSVCWPAFQSSTRARDAKRSVAWRHETTQTPFPPSPSSLTITPLPREANMSKEERAKSRFAREGILELTHNVSRRTGEHSQRGMQVNPPS